jgi:hypothetical protein
VKCRNCGAEIAEKAIICYRCGEATTEARFKAPPSDRLRSRLQSIVSVLAIILAVLLALYLGRAATGEVPRYLSWTIAGFAGVLLIVRLIARRR